jgi:excisionase family DNA binding protein
MGTLRDFEWVAARLGISKDRAYTLARLGILPAVRLGRQVRMDEEVLHKWIVSGGARQQDARTS